MGRAVPPRPGQVTPSRPRLRDTRATNSQGEVSPHRYPAGKSSPLPARAASQAARKTNLPRTLAKAEAPRDGQVKTSPRRITPSNLFTISRVLLAVPVFAAAGYGPRSLAVALYSLGILTDAIDGRLARRTHTTSPFGRAMDSTADKVVVAAAMAGLSVSNELPAALLFAFVLREFLVFGLRGIRTSDGRVVASINDTLGRVRFIVLHTGVIVVMFPFWQGVLQLAGLVTVLTAVVLSYVTFGFYLSRDWPMVLETLRADPRETT